MRGRGEGGEREGRGSGEGGERKGREGEEEFQLLITNRL